MSRLPPIPPAAITTHAASISRSSRLPSFTTCTRCGSSRVTRVRKRRSRCERRGCFSIAPHTPSTMPCPQPQQRWKRGTELPSPWTPRSAQLTTGKNQTPCDLSQPPTSSRARATYCSAQRFGQMSPSSKPASVCQSCQARSNESLMPERRCSGVSTMNVPPNASRSSPPSSCGWQRSISSTSRPNSSSSSDATSPAIPAPMTTTSARSAKNDFRRHADRVDIAGHQQRGHDRLAPRLDVLLELLLRTDQRQLLDQLRRNCGTGLVALAGEEQVRHFVDHLLVAHANGHVRVEILPLRSHAAEVEGVVRTQRVDTLRDVVRHDQRYRRGDVEVVERAARAVAAEALGEGVFVEVLVAGREQHRQPAVTELGGQSDVLRALGAQVDRDVLAQRVNRRLQRLSQPRRVLPLVGQRVVLALDRHRSLARPDVAQDLDVLARARQRLAERHAVPALDHLRSRDTEAEDEAAAGEVVHRHRRHRGHRRLARRHLRYRRAQLERLRLCTPPSERRQAVGAVGLRRPDRIEAELLGLGDRLGDVRRRAACPVAGVEAQLQVADATTSSVFARFVFSTIASMIFGQIGRGMSCPMSSSISSFAPLIALAVALPPEGETRRSSLPWMTSVGAVIRARPLLRLPSAVIAASCRPVPAKLTPRSQPSAALWRM